MKIEGQTILLYALIGSCLGVIGGFFPTLFRIQQRALSHMQHFVAGIVLAAMATSILPGAIKSEKLLPICVGFVVGMFILLVLQAISHKVEQVHAKSFPLGAVVAGMIDLFIDGLLIGISFVIGKEAGLVVTLSLSFCAFFLCLTIGGMIRNFFVRLLSSIVLASMLLLGAFVATLCIPLFYTSLYFEILSFGVAALLFLACEELLKAAHKKEDSLLTTFLFFAGFLAVLVIHMTISAG